MIRTILAAILIGSQAVTGYTQTYAGKGFPSYLGEIPPGPEPKKFAASTVSQPETMDYCLTFSPDGTEIYWNRGSQSIMFTKWRDSVWSNPEPASFMASFQVGEAHLNPGGTIMLVNRHNGLPEGQARGIWMMKRLTNGWSEPRFIIPNGMRATSTQDGIIYVTDITGFISGEGDQGIIRRYRPGLNEYLADTIDLGEINSPDIDSHPLIAPDESWIIFNSRRAGGFGESDLYLSRRHPDGKWGPARNLAVINTQWADWCATLSPDGKYLFYTCNSDRDVYWVSAVILDQY